MTPLVIQAGTDAGVRWLVNDGGTGLPMNFTGWSVKSEVRRSVNDSVVLHTWSTAAGNATAGADGFVTIFWSHAVTSAWTWTHGMYSVELTSPTGKVSRLDEGTINVSAEVTR